jgi:hypothetical protein
MDFAGAYRGFVRNFRRGRVFVRRVEIEWSIEISGC